MIKSTDKNGCGNVTKGIREIGCGFLREFDSHRCHYSKVEHKISSELIKFTVETLRYGNGSLWQPNGKCTYKINTSTLKSTKLKRLNLGTCNQLCISVT